MKKSVELFTCSCVVFSSENANRVIRNVESLSVENASVVRRRQTCFEHFIQCENNCFDDK